MQDIQSGVFSGFVLLRTVAALLAHFRVQREGLFAVSHTSLLSQLPFYVPKLGFIDRDVVRSELSALTGLSGLNELSSLEGPSTADADHVSTPC